MFQKKKKNELKIIQWIHNLNFNEAKKKGLKIAYVIKKDM